MLLHWSPRSPFVHKVMVALEETGLRDRVELIRSVVPTSDPEHPIFRANPLGQIPTLMLDDGRQLYDSFVICRYLQDLAQNEILVPRDQDQSIDTLQRHALGNGLIETLVAWVMDRHLPPEKQIPARLQRYALKLEKTLSLLESDERLRAPQRFDLGDIAIATALTYLEFRSFKPGWSETYPKTAVWLSKVAKRPSMVAARLEDG